MKALFLVILASASLAQAADQVSSILSGDGNTIDKSKVKEFIEWSEPHIREYPPRFIDEDQQKRITLSTILVTGEIKKFDTKNIKDVDLLTDLGQLMAMGHNIDLPTAESGKLLFEQALAEDPSSKRANYLFGMFLVSTSKYQKEALKYLEKSYELGEKDAQYSIGLTLCRQGKMEEGIKELKEYLKSYPDNEHVKKVIQAIEDGTLKFKDTNKS
ncbi:MAG: hypothetical protein QM496_04780 [Verrucomicrobiota bacterium]